MRKLLAAALLSGVSVPAHAAVELLIEANITTTDWRQDGVTNPADILPIINGPSIAYFRLTGEDWDKPFDIDRLPFGALTCSYYMDAAPCLIPTIAGNSLSFVAPILGAAYQSLSIALTFSENIETDHSNISGAKLVSGSFNWGYAHHNGSMSAMGPILSISVPEPAIWAMMIGGFALVGGAMRHRKPVASPT